MAQEQHVQIPRVKLGTQGLEVSKLGFGCMGLTGIYNDPVQEEAGVSIITDAFAKGVTFFDTSDVYGPKTNEILVGKALKKLPREKVQLATKFGALQSKGYDVAINGRPEYVRSCCEMGELKKLVEEGKVKYIGLSEASPDTIRRAHAVHPVTALQIEWSLWTRDIEQEIVPLCRELGIGIVPYSPLGRGFFGGRGVIGAVPGKSLQERFPRFQPENLEKNKVFYTRIEKLANKHDCTPIQLALAWVLHQGDDVVPIPGTTKIKNLDTNISSLQVKLAEDDLREISDAVPIEEVVGGSIHERFARLSWRYADTPPLRDGKSSA
ncbi:hypothetical protein ACJRO7_032813 [Eucalyptus globulus]|uniref:NADP-dependent oxidoreductase domain-containing protein n=1 Tax=Eucalyptus globulus TaxID=34317 RepID=A0ABD3JKN1_EUCGL